MIEKTSIFLNDEMYMQTAYYENADKIWTNEVDSGNVAKLQ